jgi:hypothetical protein
VVALGVKAQVYDMSLELLIVDQTGHTHSSTKPPMEQKWHIQTPGTFGLWFGLSQVLPSPVVKAALSVSNVCAMCNLQQLMYETSVFSYG